MCAFDCAELLPGALEQLASAREPILVRVFCSLACMKLLFVAWALSFDSLRLCFDRFGLGFDDFEIMFARFLLAFVACEQNMSAMVLSRIHLVLTIDVDRADSGSGRMWVISDGVATSTGANGFISDRINFYCNPINVCRNPSKFSADRTNVTTGRIDPWRAVLVTTRRG